MKLLTTFITLLTSATVLAQDPNDCDTEGKARRGSDFVLREKPDNPNVASLSKIFADDGRLVTVADVFGDGNHKMGEDLFGLTWENTDDFDDVNTKKWYPQGIVRVPSAPSYRTYTLTLAP